MAKKTKSRRRSQVKTLSKKQGPKKTVTVSKTKTSGGRTIYTGKTKYHQERPTKMTRGGGRAKGK